MKIYPFIEAERRQRRNVKRACELLQVSRSAFYAHQSGPLSQRRRDDIVLLERIRQAHAGSRGCYGAPRIHAQLARDGHRHGRKRIARLMRAGQLRGRSPRRWVTTTTADPHAPARPDLIGREFGVQPGARNTRWCGDITYVATGQGWLYLATVIDIASRRVVGFATAEHLRTGLIADALSNAVTARAPEPGLIFHSDRGAQYTSLDFHHLARDLDVRLSVGRTGVCWDNAVAESFFASLKGECLDHRNWPTRPAARHAITDYIAWYNSTRLHSSLGYLSPNDYENTAQTRAA